MAFYNVVLCFTMLNGQIPFVCFLFNSVLVRTIFSEAPLINNGCVAHVRALLIFYSAAAPNTLSSPSRVLKAFVRQPVWARGCPAPPTPPCSSEGPASTRVLREARWPPANPLLPPTAEVALSTLQCLPGLSSRAGPMPCADPWAL